MNLFRWNRATRKWLTAGIIAALTLTLVPAPGRAEMYTLFTALLEQAKLKQKQDAVNRVTPTCPQGVCTGASTMPCCPINCTSCDGTLENCYRLAKFYALTGHMGPAEFYYMLIKKRLCSQCCDKCGTCPCPVAKPNCCCKECDERTALENQTMILRRLCAENEQTINELRATLTELTREVSALRHDIQTIHYRPPVVPQAYNGWVPPVPMPIQPPREMLPMPAPIWTPGYFHYYVPAPMQQPMPNVPMTIPPLQSWLPGFDTWIPTNPAFANQTDSGNGQGQRMPYNVIPFRVNEINLDIGPIPYVP